jgi:hypothetical protein
MTSWYPIYEYSIDGIKIRKRSRIGNATELFYIGQKISMYVNPKNVNEFYCPEEKTILVVKVFAVIGVLLLLYLVVLLVLGATIVSCGLG